MQRESTPIERGILSILLALSVCFLLMSAGTLTSKAESGGQMLIAAGNVPWNGSGTKEDPYLISDRAEFEAIADAVNGGNQLTGVYFLQTNDIFLGGDSAPWPVVGITINNTAHQFRGIFDGGQNTITGLYVNRNDDDAGLFGYIGPDGVVRNVNVLDCDVSGSYWVGGIAGRNYGIVEYCSVTSTDEKYNYSYIYGSQQYTGGIVGDNHSGGIVRYCYTGEYTCVEINQIGGGIVGRNSGGTVENCYNRADVFSNNIVRGYAGGVVGENTADSTVDNCYSTGWVEGVDGSLANGAIVGANGKGSSVTNCYYPGEFEEDYGLSGIGSNSGTAENVSPKSEEDFESGEIAWELSQGSNGGGWGQTLNDDDGNHDKHPHFTDVSDKPYATTPIYRVYFRSTSLEIDEKYYVDPGENVDPPSLPENTKWYVDGEEYNGINIQRDMNAVAGTRSFSDSTVTVTAAYSTDEQTLDIDLDKYNTSYSSNGFEYTIIGDTGSLHAVLDKDGKTITIPAGAAVRDIGYILTVNAHEKEIDGGYGTNDVTMTISVIINKADPLIAVDPTASAIRYGQTLNNSGLTGGRAEHSKTGAKVNGTFAWTNISARPTVSEAASIGCPVTFKPFDTNNYNNTVTWVTMTVSKIDPEIVTEPTAINRTYDGTARDLVTAGSAVGGTMKYWLDDGSVSAYEAEYSSTIPSKTNAGTYTVWYKAVGDDNHNDTEPKALRAVIDPVELNIGDQTFTYNGGSTFTLALDGVQTEGEDGSRTVFATLTTIGKDAGDYTYDDGYTVELTNPNYIVGQAGTVTIKPLPADLAWKHPLVFEENGSEHTVSAQVINMQGSDTDADFDLQYIGNKTSHEGTHTAEVIDLGNPNYELDPNDQNKAQKWLIFKKSDYITLNEPPRITYGSSLTLRAEVTDTDDTIYPVTVEFFVNDQPVGFGTVTDIGGTASVSADVTSLNSFSIGANIVIAKYSKGGSDKMDAATVMVDPKHIKATITGSTENIYDGNIFAPGPFEISLDNNSGILPYDTGYVDIDTNNVHYTYDNANAGYNKTITAQDVTLYGSKSGNYFLDPPTIIGTVYPKPVKLEWRGVNGLFYTGDPVNVNATALELIPGDECTVLVANGQQINAGTYTAMAGGLSTSNYTLPGDDTIYQKYTIAPASLYIPAQTFPYSGMKNFNAETGGLTPEEKIRVTLATSSADPGDYKYSDFDTGASIYTAITDNTNYRISGGGTLTIQDANFRVQDPAVSPGSSGGSNSPDGSAGSDRPGGSGGSYDPGGSGGSDYPGSSGGPSGPGGSVGSWGYGGPTVTFNDNDPDDKNDQDDEDVSADAAAYAAGEEIGTASVLHSDIIMILPVSAASAALTFILKKKYSGHKNKTKNY